MGLNPKEKIKQKEMSVSANIWNLKIGRNFSDINPISKFEMG